MRTWSVDYFQAALKHGDLSVFIGYVGDQVKSQNGAMSPRPRPPTAAPGVRRRASCAPFAAAQGSTPPSIGPDGRRKDGPDTPAMIALLSKAAQRTPAQVAETLAYIDPDGRVDTKGVLRQIAWYKSQGMVKPDVDGAEIIDKRY